MHVLFISACQKKAVRRSRAILDSYAMRAGDRCWVTPMTDEALREVRAALAGKATRQTAVACYQNDGRRMKLLWIVGSRSRFGAGGHFPAGHRKRAVPAVPAGWVRHAGLAARLSGLLHDFGKYSTRFQDKLRGEPPQWDSIRHEWISLRLWQALRKSEAWAVAWRGLYAPKYETVLGDREIGSASRYGIASARECVDALIATHHGLFSSGAVKGVSQAPRLHLPKPYGRLVREKHSWTDSDPLFVPWDEAVIPEGLCETARRLDARLERASEGMSGEAWTAYWRAVFLYARAALVLADHTISAQQSPSRTSGNVALANTRLENGKRCPNQPLEEHLARVSERAADTVWRLAQLAAHPEASLDGLEPCAREALLRPADPEGRFAWQNEAAEALSGAREEWPDVGVLVFNMAGTGSGKTRMNVRAACVLSRSGAPRLSIALNLRSLTLQTGKALQSQLGIGESDLATVIGDSVARKLFESADKRSGHDADGWSDDDGNPAETEAQTSGGIWTLPAWLDSFFPKAQERRIVGAPLLVSTIDYLIAAGEPHRQGHHVKALLRLMSADLVLDEVDAYEPEPLVAVLRLVQLCALFGRNVICSSATLSHPVARAVAEAYASGADMARRLRNGNKTAGEGKEGPLFLQAFIDDGIPPSVQAVQPPGDSVSSSREECSRAYACRLKARLAGIAQKPVYRLAELFPLKEKTVASWLEAVGEAASLLHARHAIRDGQTGVRYSFGLVRVANIRTAVDTACYLAERLPDAMIACYHAGDWRISRFHKERRLDFLLSRAAGDGHIVADAEIRSLLEAASAEGKGIPFIVVATPVEEVGRDHDFDWAVVDVSSAQSLVQTAGRVNRHRLRPCAEPNVIVPQFNWRHCHNQERGQEKAPAFRWPGYEEEGDGKRYSKHDLEEILPWKEGRLDITAAVRLETATCSLARRDDKAITERLGGYFGGQGEPLFTALPVASQLLSDGIYNSTPLRNATGEQQRWRLRREEFGEKYERYVPQTGHDRFLDSWVDSSEREFRVVEAKGNAWLWLDTEAMSELCAEAGIEEERAMTADLVSYKKERCVWEYDRGFGIACRSLDE